MTACERIGWVEVGGGFVAWHCEGLWGAAVRLSELAGTWSDVREVEALARELAWDDPADLVYLSRVQRYVHDRVPYFPDAQGWYQGEVFRSPEAAIQLGGDCDCHARLVLALLRVRGIPGWLMFLGTTDAPEHVCAQAAIWPARLWLETTIPAALGDHPMAALLRRKGAA